MVRVLSLVLYACVGIGGSALALVGGYRYLSGTAADPNAHLWALGFAAVGFACAYKAYRLYSYITRDHAWYAAKHPELVKSGGVQCPACKGDRIALRNLLQHSYTRAHVCANCGTTLYYSAER